jgi:hypothetical protein
MNDHDHARLLAWKLNWWRQSELEGALLLGRLVAHVSDAELCCRLTRHCAEEAEHSRLWTEVLAELALPHVRIHRSYQAFFLEHTDAPRTLVEVLAFTQVFEKRVHRHFHEELRELHTPAAARRAYERMIQDEKRHLAWVAAWLARRDEADEHLQRFELADRAVSAAIAPFVDRLWEIPGLGTEVCEEVAA